MTESLPNSVRALRLARKMSLEALGAAIDTDASTVAKIERGQMRLSDRWVGPISAALGVTAGDLFTPAPPGAGSKSPARDDVRQSGLSVPGMATMPLDLPVMGTAAGSHLKGAFQFEGGVIDYVRRPPALAGAATAYALYVENDSMSPLYPHGELIIVHPGRPARIGDAVVVQSRNHDHADIEATLGILAARSGSEVKLQKLNPAAFVAIRSEFVQQVHKVLTISELFGV